MAYIDDKIQETGFLAIILNADFDRQSAKSFPNFGENQHFGFRKCFSRYSSHVPMTSSGFVEFYITDFWIVEQQCF